MSEPDYYAEQHFAVKLQKELDATLASAYPAESQRWLAVIGLPARLSRAKESNAVTGPACACSV